MIGAILGDIIGSPFERVKIMHRSQRCTDDSILTIALADSILTGISYEKLLKHYYKNYEEYGYGASFARWAQGEEFDYSSYGNGAIMRVSPIGWAYDSLAEVLEKAKESAMPTHSHPEGVKAAQCVASMIYLGRTGASKDEILEYVKDTFNYEVKSYEFYKKENKFRIACQDMMPAIIRVFEDSNSWNEAIWLGINADKDTDTIAAILGSICEAYYKYIPIEELKLLKLIPKELYPIVKEFADKYIDYIDYL